MDAKHLFHLAHCCAQALRRLGSARIALATKHQSTRRTATQGGNRRLIAFGDGVIHPAEVSIGIGGARRADHAPSQVHINDQGTTGSHQREHLTLEKGAGDLLQHLLKCSQGGVICSGKRAAEAGVVREGVLLPCGMHGVIGDERLGSEIEVLEIVKASEDADEELDQLGLRRMGARALGEGDGLQALNEAEVLGEFAEENQPSMVGGQVEGWLRRGTEVIGGLAWPVSAAQS